MKYTDFYKEFYFREIDRKYQLNNDINIPILLLSAIVSIHTFLYSHGINKDIFLACIILSSLSSIFGLYSLYFLFKSFSNGFKSHRYKEIADANSYYEFEKNLIKKVSKEEAEISFNNPLTKELADCSGHNFKINKGRTENLADAKKGIFFSIIFTLLLCVTFSISILVNMSNEKSKEDSSTQKPTSETQPKGPQSVYIKNSKQIPNKNNGK